MNDSVAETSGVEEGDSHTPGQGEENQCAHTRTHTQICRFSSVKGYREPFTTFTAYAACLSVSLPPHECLNKWQFSCELPVRVLCLLISRC